MQARSKPQLFRLSALTLALLTSGAMAQTTPHTSAINAKLQAATQNQRADYDLDNDGLIEINSLADLDEIRNNLDGKTLYGSSVGCPAAGCNGFELTRTLDFDTNADGKLDKQDAYWNEGKGWLAISKTDQYFTARFDGNGYQIRNLMINRPNEANQGLFGSAKAAVIRNLGLTGSLMSITADFNVGALGGGLFDTKLQGCYATGPVTGTNTVGGLAGYAGDIQASFYTGHVTANTDRVGALVGSANSVDASFAADQGLALAGATQSSKPLHSYWVTGANQSALSQGGAPLAQLQCPTSADNNRCAPGLMLYEGWAAVKDELGQAYWDFGTDKQLPGLVLNGQVFRDSDGDGTLDGEDVWPNNRAAAVDTDKDGFPDSWSPNCDADCRKSSGLVLDQVPNSAAAHLDADQDGLPEAWNAACDAACQTASGLSLDAKPNDADNDGILDAVDNDDNNDGQIDADADGDGLIEIHSWAELDAVRYNLTGSGRQLSADAVVDSSGCPVQIINGVRQARCSGYELMTDLDFDTNADGKLDKQDTYWNEGKGWLAINGGSYSSNSGLVFTATFEGNYHQIRNLMINRPDEFRVGLFGQVGRANLRNLGLTGPLMSIKGFAYVGSLAANLVGGSIDGCYATGQVQGLYYIGGLVGELTKGLIQRSFTIGVVEGVVQGGQLVGSNNQGKIQGVFSAARGAKQGLVGNGEVNISAFYWFDADTNTGQYIDLNGASFVVTPEQLRCPTAAGNTTCAAGVSLYQGWDSLVDAQAKAYWDFGSANQLPGLVLNGQVYRDSDGDAVLDAEDAFPNSRAASVDTDNDGFPDSWSLNCDADCRKTSGLVLDQLPRSAAAHVDADQDGLPEAWNTACDAACQTASGLSLDAKPNDADNDGILDSVDNDDNNDGQIDADSDGDGLIEIHSWAELDAVRYNLTGSGRQLSAEAEVDSSGCPVQIINGVRQARCSGYELMADLDFDTNADGKLDKQDSYWHEGQGWLPIGLDKQPFSARFEGNGHQIRNLMINRPSASSQGLFAKIERASINKLGLTGPLMSIEGNQNVGAITGWISNSQLQACYATGKVQGQYSVGGLVGSTDQNSSIKASFASVQLLGNLVGGLVGDGDGAQIEASFAVAQGQALTGYFYLEPVHSYWTSLTPFSAYLNLGGASLAQLQCPTSADNRSCAPGLVLYEGWSNLKDESGQAYWDFGSDKQLPGLVLNGQVFRDSDGDGILDGEDVWPNNRAAAVDADKDGFPDSWSPNCDADCRKGSGLVLDQVPNSAAAHLDADRDALPDAWNSNCDVACQAASGLTLDTKPNDVDNDGILDAADNDNDNDGKIDADTDGDGLIEIHSWAELDAVRYNLSGSGRQLSATAAIDSSGCPVQVVKGVRQARCSGYELMTDLDFSTEANTYWNQGKGWLPIGTDEQPFVGRFEGNGHQIRNLMINRLNEAYLGLFGHIQDASITKLALTGPLMSIRGYADVGAIAGLMSNSRIQACYVTGAIQSEDSAGGLVGASAGYNTIKTSFFSGQLLGKNYAGGLIGENVGFGGLVRIETSLALAQDQALVGRYVPDLAASSYWASGSTTSTGGASLAQLQCPTSADNSSCAPSLVLYEGWSNAKDESGQAYWNFGTDKQLPGLVLNGQVYRDSDGDGVLDADDAFPNNAAASQDQDKDGLPERWTLGCDATCQNQSGLQLDPPVQLLWHHQDGSNYLMQFTGSQLKNEYLLNRNAPEWQLSRMADLNGDAELDLIWRHQTTGEIYLYLMQSGHVVQQASLAMVKDLNWQLAASTDVNNDQQADLIWRHQLTGEMVVWLMRGTNRLQELPLPSVVDKNWQLIGGMASTSTSYPYEKVNNLLWHNSQNGENVVFKMNANGQFESEADLLTVADHHWQIARLADFNGDGNTDQLWRNSETGANYLFIMNGASMLAQYDVTTVADQNWHIEASADFDADGKDDLVWRHQQTGETYLWLMDGHNLKREQQLRTVPDLKWQIQGASSLH